VSLDARIIGVSFNSVVRPKAAPSPKKQQGGLGSNVNSPTGVCKKILSRKRFLPFELTKMLFVTMEFVMSRKAFL